MNKEKNKSSNLDRKIEEVKKDNVCPSCPPDDYLSPEELTEDVDMINVDENTRDRG